MPLPSQLCTLLWARFVVAEGYAQLVDLGLVWSLWRAILISCTCMKDLVGNLRLLCCKLYHQYVHANMLLTPSTDTTHTHHFFTVVEIFHNSGS